MYNKIGDHNIYIGPYPQNEADIEILAKEGVTAVINVQTDLDFIHRQIDWNLNLAAYSKKNIKIVRLPIQDFSPDDLRVKLLKANETLNELLKEGHVVYVHCTAGMSRAAATVLGYLVIYEKYTLSDAFDYVKSYRSVIAPNMKVLSEVLEKENNDSISSKNDKNSPVKKNKVNGEINTFK